MITEHMAFSDEQGALLLLDQRKLPGVEETFACTNTEETIYALQTMVIRGAPAIGVTAAYGCWLALQEVRNLPDWKKALDSRLTDLENARPTAVNLRWAVRILRALWKELGDPSAEELSRVWLDKAKAMHAEDILINKRMGAYGADLIEDGDTVMTHCNAGALATAGWGTAVGVIYSAWEQGKNIRVIANETRPFLQGARLTSWEVQRAGIPVKVACDNACALLMKKGLVQKVVVGADRVAANGDAVNKIGTFGVAVLAQRFNIPFYVAAPTSTLDGETPTGDDVPIEDRTPREVTHVGETCIVPQGMEVYNLAFDPTPNDLIAGIITEKGVLRPPYTEPIRKALSPGAQVNTEE